MVVCHYFLNGSCKYGSRCRFEHTDTSDQDYRGNSATHWVNNKANTRNYNDRSSTHYVSNDYQQQSSNAAVNTSNRYSVLADSGRGSKPQTGTIPNQKENLQMIASDVESSNQGKQWEFSCYAPFKDGDNFPGLKDLSPEEMRWDAYQCKIQGTTENFITRVAHLRQLQRSNLLQLINPSPEIIEELRKLYFRVKASEDSAALNKISKDVSTGSAFTTFSFKLPSESAGSTPSSGNAFQLNEIPEPVGRPSVFGGSSFQNNSSSPSLFGNKAEPQNVQSTFGASMQQPNQSLFGGSGRVVSTNNSSFNASNNAPSTVYSTLENLTDEEKQQFMQSSFTIGSIPEKPPPRELVL